VRPLLGLLLLLAAGAAAQNAPDAPPSSPEDADAAQQARERFLEGIAHFRERRFREAIQSFELAAERVPSADLSYNIARSYEELAQTTSGAPRIENLDRAVEYYRFYLRDRVDPPDRDRVEAKIASLEERLEAERVALRDRPTRGTLTLIAPGATETVLDGADRGPATWEEELQLDPGRHDLRLGREGYIPFRSEVTVEAGVRTAAVAELAPATRYRATRGRPVFAYVVWGLAAVSLGTGIALGVDAASRPPEQLDDARTVAAFGDAAVGGALGLGVLGLIVWFVESRSVGTERIEATPEPQPAAPEDLREATAE
jgi:tetratricopeptide (TPR) repeat protein